MSFRIEINPELKMKSDIMFKAFYGRKENEEFLQDFLESVLGEKIKIKKVMHDVRLEQLGPGEDYKQLKPTIIIAILDYSFINLPEYITETVRVVKEHREYEINNDVKYYYIELEKFRNKNPDMTKRINQWSAFLDMERRDLLEMACKENDKVKRAVENYEVLTGDEEVKRLAEIRLMSKLEEKSALDCAREEGLEQGLKRGKKEIAQKLKKQKIPAKQIAEITGLSEVEIENLK